MSAGASRTDAPASAAPTRGDALLRAAFGTWSRRDRAAAGEIVLDAARDHVDAGGSPAREARGIAATGMTLRLRGAARGVRIAPWEAAAPLALAAIGTLVALLVGTQSEGWQAFSSSLAVPGAGRVRAAWADPVLFGAGVGLAVVALLGHRRAAVAAAGVLALALAVPYLQGAGIGDTGVSFGYPERYENWGPASFSESQTQITLDGVIAVLAFVALLVSTSWAIIGRRASSTQDAVPGRRVAAAACAVVVLAGPTLAALLDSLTVSLLPSNRVGVGEPGLNASSMYALWLAMLATYAVAVFARKRQPAVALVAVIVGAALWVPMIWTLSGLVLGSTIPLSGTIGEGPAVLLIWAVTGTTGLIAAALVTAATGRHTARQAGGPDSGTPTPTLSTDAVA